MTITKSDDSPLQDIDITQGLLSTKISSRLSSSNFTGEKIINVKIIVNTQFIDLGSRVYQINFKDNDLYTPTYSGKIYKIDIISGIKTEIIDLGLPVFGLVFKDNDLFGGTYSGKIYKIEF